VIRVAVAEDQPLVRAGIRAMLDQADDLALIGEAADGRVAVELARRERPDVLLWTSECRSWTASRRPAGSPRIQRRPW
jgi:DNA-binding NarL/FixJ family response regulator